MATRQALKMNSERDYEADDNEIMEGSPFFNWEKTKSSPSYAYITEDAKNHRF